MYLKSSLFLCVLIIEGATMLNADAVKNVEIPIKKVSLFSSGVGYFEHKGVLDGSIELTLPFQNNAMNDALKSLVIYDPSTSAPFVSYPSEETLKKTLEDLKINLSNNPTIPQILSSLKGAEIEIYTPDKIIGKIIGTQVNREKNYDELSLFVDNNIKIVPLNNVTSYRFTDAKISDDFNRALEIALNLRNENMKNIHVYLPSNTKREIALSYVITSPVWKATYRLDLSDKNPFLQGWAIVDNAGNTYWKDVELSLVVGRPISFIQPLYAPYYVNRPTLPLSIAGFAEATVFERGYRENKSSYDKMAMTKELRQDRYDEISEVSMDMESLELSSPSLAQNYQTANTNDIGEQFVFTVKNPVTLERRQSAMIPLVQSHVELKKVSVFSAQKFLSGQIANPSLGVELKNDSGMKLPAGPISVYEDGSYAGDALIEFLGQNEKCLISYGDDLDITGLLSQSQNSYISLVKINKGVLHVTQKIVYEKNYLFKNYAKKTKNLILEHPFVNNAKLIQPSKYSEKTGALYRFEIRLPADNELKYTVKEELPYVNTFSILDFDIKTLISYSNNKEIPQNVKAAFEKTIALLNNISDAENRLNAAQKELGSKESEHRRIISNIEAVGKDSIEGKTYIKRLTALDDEFEKMGVKIEKLRDDLAKSQKVYKDYVEKLNI
ncbi:MAG: DUF4139 domain-containing protein [Campylobacteraceae bacterium]|jgi:hypothetical protein|nr:DUF4139 domain-containing protein [Campylobacteraceae bacterium]